MNFLYLYISVSEVTLNTCYIYTEWNKWNEKKKEIKKTPTLTSQSVYTQNYVDCDFEKSIKDIVSIYSHEFLISVFSVWKNLDGLPCNLL